jgi:hypothetical protein
MKPETILIELRGIRGEPERKKSRELTRLIPFFRLAEQDEYLTNSQSFNEAGRRSFFAATMHARRTKVRKNARQLRASSTICAFHRSHKTLRPRKPKPRGRCVFLMP